jgi:hypothetical protein
MRLAGFFAICLGTAICSGCFPVNMFEAATGLNEKPVGSFTLSSAALGQLAVTPTSCSAGDQQFFLGGDFADEKSGLVLRLAVDPVEGPAARVFARAAPYEKAVVFRRKECPVFHFSLETTGIRINDINDYHLSLELDCANGNGDRIKGKVAAAHCH